MRVYVLYTGGTIGCTGAPLAPMPGPAFADAFRAIVEGTITSQLPGVRLTYDWFPATLDSTNMQPSVWVLIARKLAAAYADHDAFLVLHGTDTMAWTASALSFLLPGLTKPVLVTGSQLPLFFAQGDRQVLMFDTDALRNLLGAIRFMAFGMGEVGLYFDDVLYRGNRTVKRNASRFAAFASPNFPALGTYGVRPELADALIRPLPCANPLDGRLDELLRDLDRLAPRMGQRPVIQLRLFPGTYDVASGTSLLGSMLRKLAAIQPAIGGIVFESFGEGNIPDFPEMKAILTELHDRGTILVDCTQVYAGDVDYDAYATGAWLRACGMISGRDMTAIAAMAKLQVLLARHPDAPPAAIEAAMGTDLAGELKRYYALTADQNPLLFPGESLHAVGGRFQLVYDADGALILYELAASGSAPVWRQPCDPAGRLVLHGDGDLVAYDRERRTVWSTGTAGTCASASFQVDDDGGLAIRDLRTGEVARWVRRA